MCLGRDKLYPCKYVMLYECYYHCKSHQLISHVKSIDKKVGPGTSRAQDQFSVETEWHHTGCKTCGFL